MNQALPELPVLGDLIKNLYDCHYDKFFIALGMSLPLPLSPNLTISNSYPRTNPPPSLTRPCTACTILRPRDAYPRLFPTTRIIPQSHHGKPQRRFRCQRRFRRRVRPFSYCLPILPLTNVFTSLCHLQRTGNYLDSLQQAGYTQASTK